MERLTTYSLAAVGLSIGFARYYVKPFIEDQVKHLKERLTLVDMDELNVYLGKIASEYPEEP